VLQTLQQWTETSAFFIWLRESPSIWAYPTVFFVHTLGLIFTAGASIVISARLLGAAPALPISPFSRLFRPMWIGFWLTALSGIVMVGSDLEAKLGNHLFPIKMLLVVAAVACMVTLRRRVEQSSVSASTRGLALASLLCWAGVVAAGRFMAYFQ
jgi:hypothetical protein